MDFKLPAFPLPSSSVGKIKIGRNSLCVRRWAERKRALPCSAGQAFPFLLNEMAEVDRHAAEADADAGRARRIFLNCPSFSALAMEK